MTSIATLNILLAFIPEDEMESNIYTIDRGVLERYYKDTKASWSGGKFYLGGQVLMKVDEPITFAKINKVREINRAKLDDLCHSADFNSYRCSVRDLGLIENILIKYQEIYKLRLTNILYMTELKKDLSDIIISNLF